MTGVTVTREAVVDALGSSKPSVSEPLSGTVWYEWLLLIIVHYRFSASACASNSNIVRFRLDDRRLNRL
jgi:hypothetical protein